MLMLIMREMMRTAIIKCDVCDEFDGDDDDDDDGEVSFTKKQ